MCNERKPRTKRNWDEALENAKEEAMDCAERFYQGAKELMPIAGGVFTVVAAVATSTWLFGRKE